MNEKEKQISFTEADIQMKTLDAMLKKLSKTKKGKYRINTRGEPNRMIAWRKNDKEINKELNYEIQIWLDGSNSGFNVSGYVSYDDYDKEVRYWRLIKFEILLPTLNNLNLETFAKYVSDIDGIVGKDLEPAGTIDNPFPFMKLKWSMKISELLRGIFNF